MAFVLRSPGRSLSLPDRLAELGRGRRRAGVAAGLFRLAAGSMALLAGLAALDAAVHLPAVARAVGLVAWLTATVVLYLRGVHGPARHSTRPLSVALLLEAQFPKFNDALATAVDLLTSGRAASRFRDVTVLRAENLAKRTPLDSIVPMARLWKGFWLLVVVGLAVVPLAGISPGRTALALARFFDPLGDHPWPTKTRLTLLDPVGPASLLARGDAFPVRFEVGGQLPEVATLVVRLSGGGASEEVLTLAVEDGRAEVVVEHRIDAGRVPRNFDVRVQAGDAVTPWHAVEVAPGPKLVALDGRASPQLDLTFPAYTDLPPAVLADGAGVVEAVAGTRVHFLAAADRRIVSAAFVPQFDTSALARATAVASLSSVNPLAAVAAQLLADGLLADIPVNVTGSDGTLLEARFTPHQPGLYALRFADERGLVGVRLVDFRVFPDPSPVVLIERPMPGKDALQLLPTASFVLQGHAEDRPYAVRSIAGEYRTSADGPWVPLPLTDLADLVPVLPALTGGALATAPPKPFALDASRRVAVAAFKKPDGTPLKDGDTLTIRLAAADWDDRTALKEPGRSKEVEVRVLSRPSLEATLLKALADLRPEALRLEAQQRETAARTAELKAAADAGPLSKEDIAKLQAAEQEQRQLRAKVADATDGLRAKVEQLRQTAQANALTRSPTADKIEAIAGELNRLADQSLEAAEAGLSAAKQEAEKPGTPDPKKVAEGLKQAAASQPAAAKSLKAVLERLEQWGGAGEVRGEARNLKDEVAKAGDQAAKTAGKVPPGKDPEKLTPAEKSALGGAADKLDAAAARTADLLAKAGRIADHKDAAAAQADAQAETASPPEADALKDAAKQSRAEADALRQAVQAAGGDALPADLREAAADTRGQKPNEAEAARQSAQARLDKLADALTEKPPDAGTDELTKRAKAAAEQIDRLAVEQDELRKKTKAAAAKPDGPDKDAALKQLAGEQERLRKKTEELVERLTREPQGEAQAEALRRAAEKMEAARDDLERGVAPTPKQDEALDKLDEALDRLERTGKQDQQQLDREEREKLADKLTLLRDRQKAVAAEAARIDAAATAARGFDRALQRSLRDLGEGEAALADEVAQFAEKSLTGLPVFEKLANQAATAMRQATKRVVARGEDVADLDPGAAYDPVAEAIAAKRVNQPLALALRRLDQIVAALQPDPKDPAAKKPDPQLDRPPMPMPMPMPDGDAPPMPPKPDTIPALAQLKALRAMQLEVNERTAAFAEANPDSTDLDADALVELRDIELAQRDIADLFDALATQLRDAQQPKE